MAGKALQIRGFRRGSICLQGKAVAGVQGAMIATRDAKFRDAWRAQGLHAGRTIAQEIAIAAKRSPELALHFSLSGSVTRVTFAEIARESRIRAAGLAALGLRPGDRIAVQAPHSRENMILFAAAMHLGLVYVPVVGIYGSAELSFITRKAGIKAIAVPAQWRKMDYAGRIRNIDAGVGLDLVIELEGGSGSQDYGRECARFGDLAGEPREPADVDPNDDAIILFTSGSTGQAKGAVHSHESAMAELRAAATFIAQLETKTLLSPLPTGHVAGIMALLRPFIHSLPTIYMDHWDVDDAMCLMREHQVGWSYGTPLHLTGILDALASTPLPRLKAYQIGGAGVPRPLIERAAEAGISACRGYGSTEQPTITGNVPHNPLAKRVNSDGQAMPGVMLKLVSDDGQEVPQGEPGEIVCTGPDQFIGYLDEENNRDAFDEAGWFRTGDIGVMDEDGYVAIVDRKKDIIIRAGVNIASKEVEDELLRHPRILEAAAVGVADDTYGERVGAVVMLREGTLDLEELKHQFVAAGLAIQKTPEHLFIVDDFPRTPVGKIHKQKLREMIARSEI